MIMGRLFLKFAGYILLKWALFYAYQFVGSDSKWDWSGKSTNKEGVLLAAFMLLTLPFLEIIVLFFPFQWALKQKGLPAIIILMLSFTAEFIIGWYATNQHFETWMSVKIALSILLFYIMYRKSLSAFVVGSRIG